MGIRRSIAYFADFVLLTAVYILIFFSIGILFFSNQMIDNPMTIILCYSFYLVTYIAYFCILPLYWNGSTLFKRSLRIKINVSENRIKLLILLIIKYVVFRFLFTIATFGLLVIADIIYMKKHDGESFIDHLLKIKINLL